MILRIVLQYIVNLTFGLIGGFISFLYNMYWLIVSYGSTFFSGLAFFLLAVVAGLSMLASYLTMMYAAVAGGGVLLVQQALRQAALEQGKRQGGRRKEKIKNDEKLEKE